MLLTDFIDFENGLGPSKGSILIAEPFLDDEHFQRAVILLCDHNKDESFGFVLNHLSMFELADFHASAPKGIPIYLGGPVDKKHLFFIHTYSTLDGATQITDGIFLGGDFESLLMLEEERVKLIQNVRFFIGYAGWSEHQLEEEIKERTWIAVNNLPSSLLLSVDPMELWKKAMLLQGKQFETFALFPKNVMDN